MCECSLYCTSRRRGSFGRPARGFVIGLCQFQQLHVAAASSRQLISHRQMLWRPKTGWYCHTRVVKRLCGDCPVLLHDGSSWHKLPTEGAGAGTEPQRQWKAGEYSSTACGENRNANARTLAEKRPCSCLSVFQHHASSWHEPWTEGIGGRMDQQGTRKRAATTRSSAATRSCIPAAS